jgi:murein DD-endopeptidase MepM/ murein hydrolase activator NlpD
MRRPTTRQALFVTAAVLVVVALVWSQLSSAPSPEVSPPDNPVTTLPDGEPPTVPVQEAPELWERALSGEVGSADEIVALLNDPANSDLEPDDFITATQVARDVLVARATGTGRERWPGYFVPSTPELPQVSPPLLCSTASPRAANARRVSEDATTVQVLVVWNGTCPTGQVDDPAAPAATVIDLERAEAGWAPVPPVPALPGNDPDIGASLDGRRFPVAGQCTFTDDFEKDAPASPYLDGDRPYHGAIDIQAPAGTPVSAIERGVVSSVGWTPVEGSYVILAGGSGIYWLYGGLGTIDPGVFMGAPLEVGAAVGTVGVLPAEPETPHLHLVQLVAPASTTPVNPFNLLRNLVARDAVPCQVAG